MKKVSILTAALALLFVAGCAHDPDIRYTKVPGGTQVTVTMPAARLGAPPVVNGYYVADQTGVVHPLGMAGGADPALAIGTAVLSAGTNVGLLGAVGAFKTTTGAVAGAPNIFIKNTAVGGGAVVH